jgi:methionyl-tRNA synthetase
MNDNVKSNDWGIDPNAQKIGVSFRCAYVFGVNIKKKINSLNSFIKERRQKVLDIDPDSDPVLREYRAIFERLNIVDVVSSPEYLVRLVHRSGKLPQINSVVDVYNQISSEYRVVASAHDLDKINGPVRLEIAHKKIPFEPIGAVNGEWINPGEWYVHDDKHSLCRLNCKQSRFSSTNLGTKNLFLYLQGNRMFSEEALLMVIREICIEIIRFNGGHYTILM